MTMKCRVFLVVVAVHLVFSALPAVAQGNNLHTSLFGLTLSGNDFWKICRTVRAEKARCVGYVMGLMDGLALMQNALARERASYPSWSPVCTPRDVTGDEMVKVLVGYLRDNPDRRNQAILVLFLKAARKAWPCESS